MTLAQYDAAKRELQAEFDEKKKQLAIQYARENNPYKQGDVISDHMKTIRIEKWRAYVGLNNYPMCIYTGTVLKKDGTEAKNQKDNEIYQQNIKL